MKRITMFSLIMLMAAASVASTTNGNTQNRNENVRPRRAWAGQVEGNLFDRGSYMGITLDEVDAEAAQRLRLREERGALVSDVVADGPAAQAGLKKDDVIVRWNGQPVDSAAQLARHRQETPAGRTVRLGVMRDGREMEVDLKLGERRGAFGNIRPMAPRDGADGRMFFSFNDRARLGASLQSLTPQLAEYFGLSGRKGVLVSSVAENSAAAKGGLQAGDIILSIGGENVDNPMEIGRLINRRDEGPVEVKIYRNKQERSLTIQLEKGQGAVPGAFERLDELITLPMELSFDTQLFDLPLMNLHEFALPPLDLKEFKFFDGDPSTLNLPKIVIPKSLNRVHL
ncbi:MAG TPA: PDZ domain-containing protein [Blastocatellia bacterium]|nr:PDZ domain-containing protein [Blastocatellia bacterium]